MIEQFFCDYKILQEPGMLKNHKMFSNKYDQLSFWIVQNQLISHDKKETEQKVKYSQALNKTKIIK